MGTAGVRNSKEERARKTLRNIQLEGHTYVDLRKEGKGFVFFCVLCGKPCYSEPVLRSHLSGKHHMRRHVVAMATLFGDRPWPFDDGMVFFRTTVDEEEGMASQRNENINLLDHHQHADNLAIVMHNDVSKAGNGFVDKSLPLREGAINELVVPNVIGLEDVSDLRVTLMGFGKIATSLFEKDGVCTEMQRIWCEWMGKRGREIDELPPILLLHDFAIVTFDYYYDLGREGLFEAIGPFLLTGVEDSNDGDVSAKRRRVTFSDLEVTNKEPSYKSYSSGEESQASSITTSSALLYRRYSDQILHSDKFIPSRKLRKKYRKERNDVYMKSCFICKQRMLPGKDVATLMNVKTGRLVCSSRNVSGAFHVYHTSCLIHWILLCESEMFMKPPPENPKGRAKSRRRTKNQQRKTNGAIPFRDFISSVFCPDCQGTGVQIEGDKLEQPPYAPLEVYLYKMKLEAARQEWLKSPEELKNCSTGLGFPAQGGGGAVEMIKYLKLLQFYRADEEGRYMNG